VITGAADGIGKALAANLFKKGCSLALCDVNHMRLEEAKSEMRSTKRVDVPKILTRMCDASDKEKVQAFASEVAKSFDVKEHRLLLFNNAGIAGGNSFFARKKKSGNESLMSTGRVHTTCVELLCLSLSPHHRAMM